MNEQTCEGPEVEEKSRGAGTAAGRDEPESVMEPQEGQEEPGRGMWQEFLQNLQTPHSAWGNPQLSVTAPWDDAKAFLASFEQVAEACRWPRGEWVARLMPALSGEAQQAFSLLEARDKGDYGKVKAAILRGNALRREMQRQHFRQFCCQELEDPRRMYSQLQELCCRWLKPERHTKEQILELLVLEQFLASLPVDVQGWIRAGGPDSCAQAVALLEDFLLSRRGAETGMWQEPLREWTLGALDVKEEHLNVVQGEITKENAEIFHDTKQNVYEMVALPGAGIACPTELLPPEGQDMNEDELNKAFGIRVDQVMNPRETGGTLHEVEQTLMQSSQQTTFWKALQEDGENAAFMDGFFGPPLDIVRHPVKKEQTFLLDPVQHQGLPGQDSDDGKGYRLKVKNSQVGGNEPEETTGTMPRGTQGNVLVAAEVQEERRESIQRQGAELRVGRKESRDLTEGLGAACSGPSPVETGWEKGLYSRYGRRYHPKSTLVFEHTGEECSEGPLFGEKIHPKPDRNHSSHIEDKNHDCSESGLRLHSNLLAKHRTIHPGEMTYKCPDCGESFSRRFHLSNHQFMHTGKKPHKCADCGKIFSWKSHLLNHELMHTGKKPHKCFDCGKCFSRRSDLSRHVMIHTGRKPHKCSYCGKNFTRRAHLLQHQMIHTRRKPHRCPGCGKSFSERSALLKHQKIHTERNVMGVLWVRKAEMRNKQ